MRKLTILLCVLLLLSLAGFTFREEPADYTTPVQMKISASDGAAEVLTEDGGAIREVFDLYLSQRSRAAAPEAVYEPPQDAVVYTVRFYETPGGEGFGLRFWSGGPFLFFGEAGQEQDLVYAPETESGTALTDLVLDILTAPAAEELLPEELPLPDDTEPPIQEEAIEEVEPALPLPGNEDGESVPEPEIPAAHEEFIYEESPLPDDGETPLPETVDEESAAPAVDDSPLDEPEAPVPEEIPAEEDAVEPVLPTPMADIAGAAAPVSEEDASQEPGISGEDPSEEPSEDPLIADGAEDLGWYDLSGALGGAQTVDISSDSDTPPLWAGETEHTGAGVTVYYARDLEQTELRWQRWWSDRTRTQSVTAEEFENARAFYRESMPTFSDGLSVGGNPAFFFDMAGDASLLWYDAGRDLIFQITAYAVPISGEDSADTTGAWELAALAESLG